MKVKFQNTFRVQGFNRKRFLAYSHPDGGVCEVPDAWRKKGCLPATAIILPDDHDETAILKAEEDALAREHTRASAEAEEKRIKEHAGLPVVEDEDDEVGKIDENPVWEFDGQVYKTEAAMKSAITRKKNKEPDNAVI